MLLAQMQLPNNKEAKADSPLSVIIVYQVEMNPLKVRIKTFASTK